MLKLKLATITIIAFVTSIYLLSPSLGYNLLASESILTTDAPTEVYLPAPLVITTTSKFTEEIVETGDATAYQTITEIDPDKDACSEPEVKQPGLPGRKTTEIKIVYYDGSEYSRETVARHTDKPVNEIIVKGAHKNYQTIQTDSGQITYWCKLGQFSATAYDATCAGCNQTTAIGLKTGFGVVAVDKHVIPLGSQLYITGYGKAIAGDTGGAIKGRRIDLGFDSIGAWWGKREVEIYLM